jgi:plasmid maintenance system antidote protein VapI
MLMSISNEASTVDLTPTPSLRMGSRRGESPRGGSEIAERLTKEIGLSLAQVARLLGVLTSAIFKILHGVARESSE